MSFERALARNMMPQNDDDRTMLLRAMRLLDDGRRYESEVPAGAKPAAYALSRILTSWEDLDEAEVTLTKMQAGPLYCYEVNSGRAHVERARASGKQRVRGTLVAVRNCDPTRTNIIGFSLWRDNELLVSSLDPEFRSLLLALGVPSMGHP